MSNKRSLMTGWLFLLPNFIIFFFLGFIPLIASLAISFTNWNGIKKVEFVGFENYSKLFVDAEFWKVMSNTLIWSVGTVAGTTGIGLLLALLLKQKLFASSWFRAAFYFPHISSFVAIAVVWGIIYHPTYGPLTMTLKSLGVENTPLWLASTKWALPSLIAVAVWKNAGYIMVIYLAGLAGIPKDLYEAASIDGASRGQQFWKITLPMLSPITFFIVVTATINSFKGFDLIYVMTKGGPGNATSILSFEVYEQAFKFNQFGVASAMSFILFALTLVITLIQFRGQKKWVNY